MGAKRKRKYSENGRHKLIQLAIPAGCDEHYFAYFMHRGPKTNFRPTSLLTARELDAGWRQDRHGTIAPGIAS